MTLYLVLLPDGVTVDFAADAHPLGPDIWLVRTGRDRSRLFHDLRDQFARGLPLMVAPLEDSREGWPKFKHLAPGALAWLREEKG
ncbi:hypothetical protein [Sphingomicrobium aestuariivivum]|uniref:hypothetical protein n=1 Tax=Sphingomicrobium aestuariivivum TaxID=1582356 RepID=UPI001FD68276|nr:hypothetical protein [Sphingomicrobium aestuariivivum]MCJ8190570.1 hypothetical protein [Sphingomicrobium aestuariivivum]